MTVFHALDEVGVRDPDGQLVHGTVDEITSIVWVKRDDCILTIGYDPSDSRLQPWAVAS
jgi:hypothetical protein